LELKEPFIPKTKNWEKEYENIVSRGEWKKIKRKWVRVDEKGEKNMLVIARPGDLYEYYPYMIWSAIVAYIGFWFIRSIIWAVQALKKE
jgi:hypothetical protein